MPYSSNLLDRDFMARLACMPVNSHLDLGAGAGKYGTIVARAYPDAHRTAVEIWEPYIERFHLRSVYHEIRAAGAVSLMDEPDQAWDLVTAGDVLEHLPKSKALDLLEWLIYRSKAIWVQVPAHYLQNAVGGNPYEAHVSLWSGREFSAYDHVLIERGDMIGAWIWGWRADYADWYAWAHGLSDGLKPSIDLTRAQELRDDYGLNLFIETGIWHGGTTNWAVRTFKTVYACDIDPVWSGHARNRFRGVPNLFVSTGDSRPFLLHLLDEVDQKALIYLDAHYIADKRSAGNPADCPLIGELNAVREAPIRHVVVIDDARLIVERHPDYLSWPTLEQVRAALPGWTVTHEGKALIAVPGGQ